jgi:UDP-N-acetylmuramate--alanine ligase
MSALAQVLIGQGHRVSGSDRALAGDAAPPIFGQLTNGGVVLCPQDGSGVTSGTDAVIVSSAIEDDNPDLGAADRLGIPVQHRAERLAELAGQGKCLAVTGTSGKTTVTALAGWVLAELGANPTVVNGGSTTGWIADDRVGNVRIGTPDLWVVEADESDRSLLNFRPEWAIITNVSRDHFELDDLQAMFHRFADQTAAFVITDSDLDANLDMSSVHGSAEGIRFVYGETEFSLALIGEHNVRNALQVVLMVEQMGYALADVAAALESFPGVHRRLERVGQAAGVTVFDDYAHNPSKITAAWTAVRKISSRVFGIWQPHGYGPLAHMYDELLECFTTLAREEDRVFVRPVFYAGGTTTRTVSSDQFVADLRTRGVNVELAAGAQDVVAGAGVDLQEGDAVLSMGARDPLLPEYARAIVDAIAR